MIGPRPSKQRRIYLATLVLGLVHGQVLFMAGCGAGGDPVEHTETDCANNVDDDGDSAVDCQDSDCASAAACVPAGETDCADQQDNDGDGLTDCADLDCAEAPVCVGSTCGDQVATGTERCDGLDLRGHTCVGFYYDSGGLACNATCSAFDVSNCAYDGICGDGIMNGVEECDTDDFGVNTCQYLGFEAGNLACDPALCTIDTSGCIPFDLVLCLQPGSHSIPLAGTLTCARDAGATEWDIYELNVLAGDCVDIHADNGAGAADLLAVAIDADGTHMYGLAADWSQLDDEVNCSVTPWDSFACPGASVTAVTSGTFIVGVAQWPGFGDEPGEDRCATGLSSYTLSLAVNGTDVAAALAADNQPLP